MKNHRSKWSAEKVIVTESKVSNEVMEANVTELAKTLYEFYLKIKTEESILIIEKEIA